jgi:hypothetical protein
LPKRLLKRLCVSAGSTTTKQTRTIILENPGEPKTLKPEERHDLQNTQTFQNEAGVARGRQDFSKCQTSSASRAGEAKINKLVCHETAHDAPVNTLTKIEAIRRAHGVRVNQQSFQFTRLSAITKPCLKNGPLLSKPEANHKTKLAHQRRFCICSLALPANDLR